jgi:hypothetical protein
VTAQEALQPGLDAAGPSLRLITHGPRYKDCCR